MGFATTSTLWCPLVTLPRCASSLLCSRFYARTGYITTCLDSLPHSLAQMLVISKDIMDNIPPERLVKVLLVQLNQLICEVTRDEAVHWHSEGLFRVKWPLSPRLSHNKRFICLRKLE